MIPIFIVQIKSIKLNRIFTVPLISYQQSIEEDLEK